MSNFVDIEKWYATEIAEAELLGNDGRAHVYRSTLALLQKYHDALVRLGGDYFLDPNDYPRTDAWLDAELSAHKNYANKVLESEE